MGKIIEGYLSTSAVAFPKEDESVYVNGHSFGEALDLFPVIDKDAGEEVLDTLAMTAKEAGLPIQERREIVGSAVDQFFGGTVKQQETALVAAQQMTRLLDEEIARRERGVPEQPVEVYISPIQQRFKPSEGHPIEFLARQPDVLGGPLEMGKPVTLPRFA
jgi:hypothetical protein